MSTCVKTTIGKKAKYDSCDFGLQCDCSSRVVRVAGLIIFGINIVKITEQETWTRLKIVFALKRISHQSSLCTVYSNLINRSHSSPTKELFWCCGLWWRSISQHILAFSPSSMWQKWFIMDLALSWWCPSSVCTNEDLSAMLHGTRYNPMSSAFLRKTPVTVPTGEPFFLCSASWWQSELFTFFAVFSIELHFGVKVGVASSWHKVRKLCSCLTCWFRVWFRPFLQVLVPNKNNWVSMTYQGFGSVNGKPCLYYLF